MAIGSIQKRLSQAGSSAKHCLINLMKLKESMTRTDWWWIRHAPVIDPQNTLYGQADLLADTESPAVARSLDRLARVLPAEACWIITPLQRTRQTAAALAERLGVTIDPLVEPALIEQHFGAWQGRPKDEIYGAMGPDHPFWQNPAATAPPDGESFADLIGRVRPVIMRSAAGGRPLVVIGHAGTIRAALAVALDLSPDAALRFHLDPLGLTRIEGFPPDGWRVSAVNKTEID